jgi:hypothetical protein
MQSRHRENDWINQQQRDGTMLHWTEEEFIGNWVKEQGPLSGIASGTRVATAQGWRPVEALAAGDLVLTFDNGLQPVTHVARRMALPGDEAILIPAGALGNQLAAFVAADQPVVLESDLAEDLYGDPFMVIEARALTGWRGIAPAHPAPGAMMVALSFETPQILFTKAGVLAAAEGQDGAEPTALTGRRARVFAARLVMEEP